MVAPPSDPSVAELRPGLANSRPFKEPHSGGKGSASRPDTGADQLGCISSSSEDAFLIVHLSQSLPFIAYLMPVIARNKPRSIQPRFPQRSSGFFERTLRPETNGQSSPATQKPHTEGIKPLMCGISARTIPDRFSGSSLSSRSVPGPNLGERNRLHAQSALPI